MSSRVAEEFTIELEPLSEEQRVLSQDELFRAAGGITLGVPHFPQENLFSWCYAACAQMVLAFYGTLVSQCAIVGFVKNSDCCSDPDISICVNAGADSEDIAAIYLDQDVSAFRHEQQNGVIELSELQDELLAGRPVEVTAQSLEDPGSFHAVIIRGFVDNWLMFNDPLSDEDFNWVTYEGLEFGEYYRWHETWTGIQPLQ